MRNNAFAADFYSKLTIIIYIFGVIFKKEEKFLHFSSFSFLEKRELICLRKVIKNVVTTKDLDNGF